MMAIRQHSPGHFDELVGLSESILAELKQRHEDGHTPEQLIWYLHDASVKKAGVYSALRRIGILEAREAKDLVHDHPAFAYRREADEAFQDAAIDAWQRADRDENADVAA